MTATFSPDLDITPQFVDLVDVSSGYGILGVPITGFLPGDIISTVGVSINGTNLSPITATVDQVQRTQGYYLYTDAASIAAFFTLSVANIAAIAAASAVKYSVTVSLTRSGILIDREVQSGNLGARTAFPATPLLISTIQITGGPAIGKIGDTTQLAAQGYDGQGNPVSGLTFEWTTSDATIATVSSTGLVSYVGLGGVVITAQSFGITAAVIATTTNYSTGALFYASTPTALAPLPIGTAFQTLRVNSTATAPEWHTFTAADISPGTFGGASAYHFPAGLIIDAGGFTVTSGSSSVQALTATTAHVTALGTFDAGIAVTGASTIAGTLGSITTLTATTVNATNLGGTLTAAAQPNVTSLGVLAAPHVTGLVVDSGGLTVTSGTTALQATTATTLTVSGAATLTGGTAATLTFGAHLTAGGASYNSSANATITSDATSANTASTIVARDGSGNFTAGTITAATGLTVSAGTAAVQALTATTGVFSSTLSVTGAINGQTISSAANFTGTLAVASTINGQTISSAANFTGSATIASGLTVSAGTAAVQALTATTGAFSSTLSSTGNLTVNTTAFTVTAASGNTSVGGTLAVTSTINGQTISSAASLTGTLTVATGLTVSAGTAAVQALTATTGVFSSTLSSTGNFAVNTTAFTVAAASGNTTVGGTLTTNTINGQTISSAANLTGTLAVASTINGQTISSAASFSGSVTVASGFTVTAGTAALQAVTATTVTATTFSGALSGNAATATALQTPRTINGVSFDGTASITVTAAAGTLTGTTLAAGVITSSLTTVGVLASPHVTALTVDSGGITVTAGTTAAQAVTATTITTTDRIQINANQLGFRALATTVDMRMYADSSNVYGVVGTTSNHDILIVANGLQVGRWTAAGALTIANGLTVTTGSTALSALSATTGTFTTSVTTSASGSHFTAQTTTSTNPYYSLQNSGGANKAFFFWDTPSDTVYLNRDGQTSSGLAMASGGASFYTGLTVTTGGLAVSSGTTAVQALTATTGGFSGGITATTGGFSSTLTALDANFGANTGSHAVSVNGASASGNAYVIFLSSGTAKWWVGRGPADNSDHFQVYDVAGARTAIQVNTSTSAVSIATGLTIAAGGITVSAGTTAVQALTGTTITLSSNIIQSNNAFLEGTTTGAAVVAIIGVSASNKVVIDNSALGTTFGSSVTIASGLTVTSGTSALQAVTATTGTFSGNVFAGVASGMGFTGSTNWNAPSDGVLELLNNAGTNFGRLQFGGTTASFPSLKRSAATLAVRLADDSADAALTAAASTFSGVTTTAGRIVARTTVNDTIYTTVASDEIIEYIALTAPRTVTLLTAVGRAGQKFTIKDGVGAAAAQNITIATTSAQTIDGASTKVISSNYGSINVYSNGANWLTF